MQERSASDLVEQLIAATDYRIEREAMDALAQQGASAVAALLPLLRHHDPQVRRRTAQAMVRLGDESAVESLANALNDDDSNVARNSAVALGKIRDARAVNALMKALKHEDSSVREGVAEALGRIGDPIARPALLEAQRDSDFSVSTKAETALRRIPETPPSVGEIPALVARFDDDYIAERARAATAVATIGSAAIGPLLEAYETSNVNVRVSVAQSMGEIRDAQAVEHLVRIMRTDPSPYVRKEAANGLLTRNDAREHYADAYAVAVGPY